MRVLAPRFRYQFKLNWNWTLNTFFNSTILQFLLLQYSINHEMPGASALSTCSWFWIFWIKIQREKDNSLFYYLTEVKRTLLRMYFKVLEFIFDQIRFLNSRLTYLHLRSIVSVRHSSRNTSNIEQTKTIRTNIFLIISPKKQQHQIEQSTTIIS